VRTDEAAIAGSSQTFACIPAEDLEAHIDEISTNNRAELEVLDNLA
jgi:hypothetical protein